MTLRPLFSEQEWKILELAPIYTFLAVGLVGGKLSRAERFTFAHMFRVARESVEPEHQLTREVMSSLEQKHDDLVDELVRQPLPFETVLAEAADVLEKAPSEQADLFKINLFNLAYAVANASGPLLGDNVSAEEEARIVRVLDALRLRRDLPTPGP